MKIFSIAIVLIIAISCFKNTTDQNVIEEVKTNDKVEKSLNSNCKASDIFILTENNTQESFFYKLDSIVGIQYPSMTEKQSADINLTVLNDFFNDLNIQKLEKDAIFEKKYTVKLTPDRVKSKNEINTVELIYFPEECNYRLSVLTYYETDEYSDEGSVSYSFKIENGDIKEFKRQEAG